MTSPRSIPLLGANLATALASRGIGAEALAAAAGLHKTTIYRILRGITDSPRPATLRRIARALSVPVHSLTADPRQLALDPRWTSSAGGSGVEPDYLDHVLEEFRDVPPEVQREAATAVIHTLVDICVDHLENVARGEGLPNGETGRFEDEMRKHWENVPKDAQLTAAEESVRAVVKLRLLRGTRPGPGLYSALEALRKERARRHRAIRRKRQQPRGGSSCS